MFAVKGDFIGLRLQKHCRWNPKDLNMRIKLLDRKKRNHIEEMLQNLDRGFKFFFRSSLVELCAEIQEKLNILRMQNKRAYNGG